MFYYFFLCAFYISNFSASNKYIFIIGEIIIKVITGIKSRVLEKKKEREKYKHLSPTTPLSHSANICKCAYFQTRYWGKRDELASVLVLRDDNT